MVHRSDTPKNWWSPYVSSGEVRVPGWEYGLEIGQKFQWNVRVFAYKAGSHASTPCLVGTCVSLIISFANLFRLDDLSVATSQDSNATSQDSFVLPDTQAQVSITNDEHHIHQMLPQFAPLNALKALRQVPTICTQKTIRIFRLLTDGDYFNVQLARPELFAPQVTVFVLAHEKLANIRVDYSKGLLTLPSGHTNSTVMWRIIEFGKYLSFPRPQI